MKHSGTDRRIRRTEKLLKESLAQLMSEKEFHDITIKDITERADLNRGTFYLHYTDTYELLLSMENDVLADFQDMIDNYLHKERTDSLIPVLSSIVHYVLENREICRNLIRNKTSNDFVLKFKELLQKNGTILINTLYPFHNTDSCNYFFEFVTYGYIGVLQKWLDSGAPEEETQIVQMGNNAVIAVLHSFFEQPPRSSSRRETESVQPGER